MQQSNLFRMVRYISKFWLSRFFGIALIPALCLSAPLISNAMEYGATGPYTVSVNQLQNTTVLFPQEAEAPVPVVFFSHGYGSRSWTGYGALLKHIASQGIAAVYTNYMDGENRSERYELLWNGFVSATIHYASKFDMSRVGFIGHSYGGGATAAMAYRGLVQKGWGSAGALMFIMAPYHAFEVSDAQLASMPTHTNLIVQVFSDDTTVNPDIAIDLYAALSDAIPHERRAFYHTEGEHSEPSNRSVDDMDTHGIHTPLDALMDYTFKIDRPEEGRAFALVPGDGHYLTTVLKDPTVQWDDPINQPPVKQISPPTNLTIIGQ